MTNITTPQKQQDKKYARKIALDYVIMLSAPLIFAIIKHGFSALLLSAISVLTSIILVRLGERLLKINFSSRFLTPVVIGLSVALMLPAIAPWWIFLFTSAFAVLVGVLPFGYPEKSPFAPALTAFCFAVLCWQDEVFSYSDTEASITELLSQNVSIGDNIASIFEVLIGNIPSAMGTGCSIILLGALVFLTILRPRNSLPVHTFLLAVIIMALLFPRVGTGRFISLIMELCGGMLLFGAIFFISLPSVMPERTLARAVWGFAGGIICMVIRYIGTAPESVCFGILITCAISDFFDKLPLTKGEKAKIRIEEPIREIPETVVPDEILEEIPDIDEKETENTETSDEIENENPKETTVQESVSLEEVVSEENNISEENAPFIIGGESDE